MSTLNKLVDDVLETNHLYRQNAAQQHGISDRPRRVTRRTIFESEAKSAQKARDAGEQTRPVDVATTNPSRPASKEWRKAAALIVATIAAGGLAGYGIAGLGKSDTIEAAQPKQGLLEYLEQEGLSQP